MAQPLTVNLIVLAIFVQVALTIYVLLRMGGTRVGHVEAGRIRVGDIALGESAWPDDATKLGNNYKSQFELPVLFYVACLLSIVLGAADLVLALAALAFVVSRIVHMLVHTGANDVRLRFKAFAVGVACMAVMWLWLGLKLVLEIS